MARGHRSVVIVFAMGTLFVGGPALAGEASAVEATGEVTSPPAPGTGLVSTTVRSDVTLAFPSDGGPVTGAVLIVNRVVFDSVFCEQEATFAFALTGMFDAASSEMTGVATEGGTTVVMAGCEGLSTSRTGFTTPWTATLDRSSGQIAGRLAGGAPVDFVAQADPAALAPPEPEPLDESATDPAPEERTAEAASTGPAESEGGGDGLSPLALAALVALAAGAVVLGFRLWPRAPLTHQEVVDRLLRAARGLEQEAPADRRAWRTEVQKPLREVDRRLPPDRVEHKTEIRRLYREVGYQPSLYSNPSDSSRGYHLPDRTPTTERPGVAADVRAVADQVKASGEPPHPGFEEIIL